LIGRGAGAAPVSVTVPVIVPAVAGFTGLSDGMAAGGDEPGAGGLPPPHAANEDARQRATTSDRDETGHIIGVDSNR